MNIIEQASIPKSPRKKSEDGIIVTKDYIAVVDGSTSKTERRYSFFSSNGRLAMKLIAKYIKKAPGNLSCQQFCVGVTKEIRKHYRKKDLARLTEHPEERLTASVAVYSRLNREIWLIGDCQCLVGSDYFDNPKPNEEELAEQRAAIIKASADQTTFFEHDTARDAIIPHMLETMKGQNITYAVVDGFHIPQEHVRVITLDFQPWEVVLATDGYPFLCQTLEESEQKLAWQREHDPLNIGAFKATKAFLPGNNSFDDRSYIRFKV